MEVSQVHREFFKLLVELLQEAGVGPEQLLAELSQRGIQVDDTSQAVAIAGVEVLETAVDLTGNPCLAIRLGQQIDIACHGFFGFALMTCANLRESVQLLLRYGQVLFEPTWRTYEHEGGLLLRANITSGTAARRQLGTEVGFSNLVAMGKSMYGETVEGAEIQLNYSSPAHSACYEAVFDVPVRFDCEHSQLFLPAGALDTPVKTANRCEHVVYHQQCEQMLRELNTVEKNTAAVRRLLIQSAGGFLDIAQVAKRLNVSERTLRRRLAVESTNFRAIFEEVRDLLAREYLAKTELTVAEIADLLDYSETVNFRRAFVRWNKLTPVEYRLKHYS